MVAATSAVKNVNRRVQRWDANARRRLTKNASANANNRALPLQGFLFSIKLLSSHLISEADMRNWLISLVMVSVFLSSVPASAEEGGSLTDKPWATGLLLGFGILDTLAVFTMELQAEYNIKVGPGDIVPHFGFLLGARKEYVGIGLPMGVRYKIRVISKPLYVYPYLDIGPSFETKSGTASGILRVGGGLSYLVHPHVEIIAQPLGLGTCFDKNGGVFLYNFLVGINARF